MGWGCQGAGLVLDAGAMRGGALPAVASGPYELRRGATGVARETTRTSVAALASHDFCRRRNRVDPFAGEELTQPILLDPLVPYVYELSEALRLLAGVGGRRRPR